jgi:glycolate oxidase
VAEIARVHDLVIGNLFHAGDGNLHPTILFDPRVPGMLDRVVAAGEEILKACVDAGGSITGEHGVGIEKRDYMRWLFNDADLEAMRRVKRAFDPEHRLNPGKLLPDGSPAPYGIQTGTRAWS